MAPPKKEEPDKPKRRRPAITPEGRENELIELSVDLVAKRLREGTATSQETTHFLKLGSTRERLEQERLRNENKLTEAKVDALASQKRQEEMYEQALRAMRAYTGQDDDYDEG